MERQCIIGTLAMVALESAMIGSILLTVLALEEKDQRHTKENAQCPPANYR